MTRDEQLNRIREACIAVNSLGPLSFSGNPNRPIRLADVLLAIAAAKKDLICDGSREYPGMINIYPHPQADRINIPEPTYCRWDGRHDDLTLQSDKTIAFIADLLP